jgi:arylsulfatase A-like enzyme
MNKAFFLFTLTAIILTFGCTPQDKTSQQQSNATDARPPNIVLIISDDMGYSDLGCYGGEIETPNLDKLAGNGVRFTNYYVHNMCWPTRASLLTSLYPNTALKTGSAAKGFRDDIILLPQALKEVGYKSYLTGKWHLSDPEEPNGSSAPHKRGFDRTYTTYHGTTDYFAPADLNENGEDRTYEWKDNPDYYYTDAITDNSLRFLKEHPKDAPFFIYVAYNAAHWPLHAKPEDIENYKGRFSAGWDHFRETRHARMKELGVVDPAWELSPRHPNVPAWEDEEHKAWQERRMEVYAAQITCMDRNIGRIVQQLKDSGQLDNTIFIYQQDNGGCHVEYPPTRTGPWTRPFTTDGKNRPIRPGNLPEIMPGDQSTWQSYGYGWANVSNTPFRLFKQYDHEGGTRSPLIMSWPKGLDKKLTGGLAGQVVHVIDMMPTLMDAAGASTESRPGLQTFEGNSFLPVIQGNSETWHPHDELYWDHSQGKAARIGEWKLVSESKQPWELYRISKDGTELNDLAPSMPEKVAELEARHQAWEKRTDLTKKK